MSTLRPVLSAVIIFFTVSVSAQTKISGYITTDTEWDLAGSPYIIVDSLIVDPSAVLTILNGTVVMFKYHPDPAKKSYMVVNGGIRFFGISGNHVIFTSERDDLMGDFNGDGNATVPRPGDWGYVFLNSDNPSSNEYGLSYVDFRYGGGRNPDTISLAEFYPMVTFRDEIHNDFDIIGVSNCTFQYSKGTAIRMGNARISDNSISECKNGIMVTSSNSELINTTIENNSGYPIFFNGHKMTLDYNDSETLNFFIENFNDNTFKNNGLNYFAIGGKVEVIKGDFIPGPMTMNIEWKKLSIPYLVTSPLEFYGLNIYLEKGTLIKFKYYTENSKKPYIYLDQESNVSTLIDGSSAKTIFTSEFDHRYDYEPFTGNHRDPMAGDWGYLEGSNFNLKDCVFKYGGVYVNPQTGEISSDSSAVVIIHSGLFGESQFSGCLFNSLYHHGILFLPEPSVDHPININNNSFLLSRNANGIKVIEPEAGTNMDANAINNYWYGKLGPFNPDSNAVGNGCRIDNNIKFKPFLVSSDDELDLVSSVIKGRVRNLDGEVIPKALVRMSGKNEREVYSNDDGDYYVSNVYPGYGYEMQAFAARHRDTIYKNIEVRKDTTYLIDVFLRERTIDYLVDTITFKVNPEISEVQVGGTAYRYYKVIDRKTHDPVYGAEVFVEGIVDTLYSNYKGIVAIPISWDMVGSYPSARNFYIKQIGAEMLPFPPEQQMHFRVEVIPRGYTKMWGGKLWLKEGISIIELKQEIGASVGLLVEDHGSGEVPVNLLLERGFKAGAGINLGASAKATLGPVEAGAEAEIGVNLNPLMKDQFIFDYENTSGRLALAKFIVLAGSAFQFLDSPLHRYLSVALLDNNPYIASASYSNSIGLNYNGYGSAKAGIGINLKNDDGSESPVGAELKGSAESVGNIDFLFTSYSHRDQLDFELKYSAEIGLGVSAGVGFDVAKLFGEGDEKDKEDKNKNDDNKFEIKIPDLLSASAKAGIKYGASISTTRNIPEPYTSMGFMYGYKYSAGLEAFSLFGAKVGEDREYHFTFDFHDKYLKNIVEEKVQLAKDISNTDISNLSLDISSLSGAKIFSSPFATFAAEQTKNAFSFPAVPYNQTITDLVDAGEFALELSFGLGPVKVKFGAGIEYTESNDYLWRSGVFYDWGLYPLQSYNYIEDNDNLDVGPVLQDILYKSGAYLWEQIKAQLIPPIFKKIHIWPFTLLKGSGVYSIPVGPVSRSSVLAVDTLSTQDSLFVFYWDWYGTEGITDKKGTINPKDLKILEYIKSKAVEVHKLDYGIGGFYQFEPNGRLVSDSAVLTINYFDEELIVRLEDSSEYTIDEMNLRMYAEDKTNHRWIYVGGVVDPVNNTVTARIDSLGTFTLAPFIPDGEISLTANPDTIKVEISNSSNVSSGIIYYNTGEVIADGEIFTIEVSKGKINTPDSNSEIEGKQVISSGGVIAFEYQSDSISGIAYLKATSRLGGATGLATIIIEEENPPEAPVITSASLNEYSVELLWNPSPDIDVAYYMVYFGTRGGPPYEGSASVLGNPSPVKAGTDTSVKLEGLYKDSTYYFALKAVDRCGNASVYSNEMILNTRFNHRPVIYTRVFKIDPMLSEGTVIDTLWAHDDDTDQELSFYFAENNTCTAFSLDPETGEIRVADAAQLDYDLAGIDTFLIYVGVRDNDTYSLSDSTEVLIILKVYIGIPKLQENTEPQFIIYPNPAANELTIQLTEPVEAGDVYLSIINMIGQSIWREDNKGGAKKTYKVNLSGIPPGLYSVSVQTKKGRGVQRLVLMR